MAETHSLLAWRHPQAIAAQGRCIGVTDLPVDPRKARRLASRIRRVARVHGLPRRIVTSTLRRSSDVGRWLRRWGWTHERDGRLDEMDFGSWDGLPWTAIPRVDIDVWCADFLEHAPGGGESLDRFFDRVASWSPPAGTLAVTHGGWLVVRAWLASGRPRPVTADAWPAPPRHGSCVRWNGPDEAAP